MPRHAAGQVPRHPDAARPGDEAAPVTCAWPSAPLLPVVLRRLGDRLPVAVLLVVLGGQLLPGGWSRLGWLPVAVGLLVGLPHGAVDHLVPARVQARRLPLHVSAGSVAGYVVAAAAMLVVLHAAPAAGLLLFLLLSLLHFGTGELSHHHLRQSTRGRAPCGTRRCAVVVRAAGVLAWGGTTVLLPLSAWPARTGPVLDALAPGTSALLTPGLRAATTAVVLLAAAAWAGVAARNRDVRAVAELALLIAVFLLAPPLVAFAGYFGGWHSVRHLVRLLATDPANSSALSAGWLRPPLRRFTRQAAAPTLLALVVLLALVAVAGGDDALLAADLVLLAALTVPHMLIVAWLDAQPHAGLPGLSVRSARTGRP